MNKLEQYLVDLLQGKIVYDDTVVEVVKQFSMHPERPVITLDLSPGVNTQHVYSNPSLNEKYIERHATININVWCDTEQQREFITTKILELFSMEQNYHYMYCTNYDDDGQCSVLKGACVARNANKRKCPLPEQYNYESLHRHHNIIIGTLNIEPPFDLDELSGHPPLLRSIMKCECQYSDTISSPARFARHVDTDINLL